jgi:transcription antitermination factor NusG
MRNDKVQDLISQLNRLQLQQTELFARLEKAIGDKDAQTRGVRKEDAQTREVVHEIEAEQTREFFIAHGVPQTVEFAIGDRVKVKNPNLFQADRGKITKIRNKRITLTTQSGNKIL